MDVLDSIPRIYCPFPSHRHWGGDQAERHVREFGRCFGLVSSAASVERFDRVGFGAFAALTCPTTHRLELMAEWAAWLFVFDDEFDEAADPNRPVALIDPMVDEARAILAPDLIAPNSTSNVLMEALADMWPRTAHRMTVAWRQRFAQHLIEYISVYRTEISRRRYADPPSFAEYLPFRRIVSAVEVCWDMIEVAHESNLPDELVAIPSYQRIRSIANDITCWTNDIISVNKEHARGDANNLVAVLRYTDSLTWREAAQKAADMVRHRTEEFQTAAREMTTSQHESLAGAADRQLLTENIDAIGRWMAGSWLWHLSSNRYQDVEYTTRAQDPSYYQHLAAKPPASA